MNGQTPQLRQTPPDQPWSPQAARSFVELFALAGLAVTQPVLDVFGRAPELFVFLDASRGDIVLFAVLVTVLPTAVLWSIEQIVSIVGERTRRVVHLGLVGLLVLLLGLGSLKQAEVVSGLLLVLLAAAFAVLAVISFDRWRGVRMWVRYLGVAPLIFLGLFLTRESDLRPVELPGDCTTHGGQGPVEDPRTIVFLQFDEWPLQTILNRDGHIDPELYPNLAALAADGVWYRNTTTAANYTTYAVPANLTGRVPEDDRSAVASEHPENLLHHVGWSVRSRRHRDSHQALPDQPLRPTSWSTTTATPDPRARCLA